MVVTGLVKNLDAVRQQRDADMSDLQRLNTACTALIDLIIADEQRPKLSHEQEMALADLIGTININVGVVRMHLEWRVTNADKQLGL